MTPGLFSSGSKFFVTHAGIQYKMAKITKIVCLLGYMIFWPMKTDVKILIDHTRRYLPVSQIVNMSMNGHVFVFVLAQR